MGDATRGEMSAHDDLTAPAWLGAGWEQPDEHTVRSGQVYVKVVADSIGAETRDRVTSFEINAHRFILAEINTACTAARNSASSRAIPVAQQLARYVEAPAYPLSLPAERPGMAGGDELRGTARDAAQALIEGIHTYTAAAIAAYVDDHPAKASRLHKSVLNRYMEPLQYHKVLYTASSWGNFLEQRAHPGAQPEFQVIARAIQHLLGHHAPQELVRGQWHLPYIPADLRRRLTIAGIDPRQVSVARCARTSYAAQWGDHSVESDLALCDKLVADNHMSPFEHPCTPDPYNVAFAIIRDPDAHDRVVGERRVPIIGKWAGWQHYRHLVEGRLGHNSHL